MSKRRNSSITQLILVITAIIVQVVVCLSVMAASESRRLPPSKWTGFTPQALEKIRASDTPDQFECGDGDGTVIPMDRVNDDYCDCPNGSDEPGTAACSHLLPAVPSFYCTNKGFIPKKIFASMVNDGVCDCCDGSDEWANSGQCENTCNREREAAVERLQTMLEKVRSGLNIRREREKNGTRELKQKRQDLRDKRDRLEKLEKELQELETVKERLEKQEEIERELRKREITNEDVQTEEKEGGEGDEAQEKAHVVEEVKKSEKGEEDNAQGEERQDENDGVEEEPYKSEANPPHPTTPPSPSPPRTRTLISRLNNMLDTIVQSYYRMLQWVYGKFNPTEAERARMEYDAKKREVDELKRTVDNLDKVASVDYGKDNQFYALRGKSVHISMRGYDYDLYFFDRATQKDSKGSGYSSGTSLGKWGRWAESDADEQDDGTEEKRLQRIMQFNRLQLYERGASCWQGPVRTARVTFSCGTEDRLTKVDEPSRCVYLLFVESPSACTEQQEQDLLQELKRYEI